jgi:hypothetical protein
LRAGRLSQFLEVDRRFDLVAQDCLARIDIAGSTVSMPFAQQRLVVTGIARDLAAAPVR